MAQPLAPTVRPRTIKVEDVDRRFTERFLPFRDRLGDRLSILVEVEVVTRLLLAERMEQERLLELVQLVERRSVFGSEGALPRNGKLAPLSAVLARSGV